MKRTPFERTQPPAKVTPIGHYTPDDTSCWNTSTYLLLTFFFAACDRDRPIGGGFGVLLGAGVFGIDATSVGTK